MAGAGGQGAGRDPGVLVFIHIPKTAGTTLRSVLLMNEPRRLVRSVGNVFKGHGGISTELIGRLATKDPIPELKGYRVVTGHIHFGIREDLVRHVAGRRRVRYYTLLREPVDRTLSHYFQVLDGGGRAYRLPPLPADATLRDALESGYIADNVQTRMLSGVPDPFGIVTDAMLEQAKQNLREEFVAFGLAERFDESLVLAKQRSVFKQILYTTIGRVNPARPRGEEVPEDLREAAAHINRYDIELYRFAQGLFDDAPERRRLDFVVELAALRAAKAEGETEVDAPAPAGYGGDEESWRMLVTARATVLRLELELARWRLERERVAEARRKSGQPGQKSGQPGQEPDRPRPKRAARGARQPKAPVDAQSLAAKAKELADAAKAASGELERVRVRIGELEANSPRDRSDALHKLRRRAGNLTKRIDTFERRRESVERQRAALLQSRIGERTP
jgi:Sulfotransferase family